MCARLHLCLRPSAVEESPFQSARASPSGGLGKSLERHRERTEQEENRPRSHVHHRLPAQYRLGLSPIVSFFAFVRNPRLRRREAADEAPSEAKLSKEGDHNRLGVGGRRGPGRDGGEARYKHAPQEPNAAEEEEEEEEERQVQTPLPSLSPPPIIFVFRNAPRPQKNKTQTQKENCDKNKTKILKRDRE